MTPDTLGPYRIDRELGSGGMGTVYRATGPDGVVALKIVHPHLLSDADQVSDGRFRREVDIGKSLRHPNVVATFTGGEIDGRHYIAMEYVEGQTLSDLLIELDRVPEELCRHIGAEVTKGLAAIHAAGAIHRDMKPENVLITGEHVVKIMDLGVARLAADTAALTQTGAFVGSLRYAAPESFQGGRLKVDGRVDLHALGLVLYELACGVNPYYADDVPTTIRNVLHKEPRRLGDVNPQLSPFFEEVVHTLLEKDRDKRFASSDELAGVLADGEESDWWSRRATMIRAVTHRPLRRVRIPRETAVYGRDAELERLWSCHAAAVGGEGNVVLIEGEAGIGKSRLVDELIGRLQREGEDFNFLFGSYPPGGAVSGAGAFSTAFREHFGDGGSSEYLAATPVLAPAFDALLRGESTPAGEEPLTGSSLQTCFVNATRALARERPTIVLIDDLHFASDEGRSLFTALAMAAPEHRFLLIGTMRPGVSAEWLAGVARLHQTTQQSLHRLGPKDLMDLLRDTLKSDQLARELAAQIATKSDGNPFFVFEILRGLREGQFITQREDGTWSGTRVIDEIEIPSSVRDLVNARVGDLTEDDRDLLDVAACWGFEFDPTLIGAVCGLGRIPALKHFGSIERRHRLVRSVGRNYVFDHHQVQEALYAGLNEQLAEEYHAALAEALETKSEAAEKEPGGLDGALCVDLCEHFLRGARGQSALRYLPAAQVHLTGAYLHAQVVALTDRALAVPDLLAGAARVEELLRLERALRVMGRRVRQEECAREAELLAEQVGDDGLRAKSARLLGVALGQTFRNAEAEVALRRALDFAVRAGDRETEALVTGNLGMVLHAQGHLTAAREHHARHLEISREIGDRRGEVIATGNLGNVCREHGLLREARELAERHLALSRADGHRLGEAIATGALGNVLRNEGRLSESRAHHERHVALSQEIGDRSGEANARSNLAIALTLEGRLGDALQHHERTLELTREIGDRAGEARTIGNLGSTLSALGRLDESREHQERYLALSREIRYRRGEAYALHNLGGLLDDQGEPTRAEEHLQACLALCEELGARNLMVQTHLVLGSLRVEMGDEAGGRAALVVARDVADEVGLRGFAALARCELACLPGGDAEVALAAFEESESRLDAHQRCATRFLLWEATGDRTHLDEAKYLLDEWVAHVDDAARTAMLTNIRLHREILAAWDAYPATPGN